MLTSLMQTAQNLISMMYMALVDRPLYAAEGITRYVAAVGVASPFMWLAMAFMVGGRIGTEIGVSQSMGRKDVQGAMKYAQNGFMLALFLGIVYCIAVFFLRYQLLDLFAMDGRRDVTEAALQYIQIAVLGLPFMFVHFLITGVYSGYGNTKLPFYINVGAMLVNIAVTPIFIFVFDMGIQGAALGLVTANVFNAVIKIWAMTMYGKRPFEKFRLFGRVAWDKIRQILKWSIPVAAESFIFTMMFMLVALLVVEFGPYAVAGQNVGIQIESLAFMVGAGFSSALTAFVGQNYAAKKWTRLREARRLGMTAMACYGAFVTVVLFVFARPLVGLILNSQYEIDVAVSYLRTLALCQILFCMDGVAIGFFRGRGKTTRPSVVIISSGIFRVAIAYAFVRGFMVGGFGFGPLAAHISPYGLLGFLVQVNEYGNIVASINALWLAVALSKTLRSSWLLIWSLLTNKEVPRDDEPEEPTEELSDELTPAQATA